VEHRSLKLTGAGDAEGAGVTTAMLADWLSSQGEFLGYAVCAGGLCLQWYVHAEQWRLRCDIYALCGASYGCIGGAGTK
jgi:hypothetical protein